MGYSPEECRHCVNQYLSKFQTLQTNIWKLISYEILWFIFFNVLILINCKATCHSLKIIDTHAVLHFVWKTLVELSGAMRSVVIIIIKLDRQDTNFVKTCCALLLLVYIFFQINDSETTQWHVFDVYTECSGWNYLFITELQLYIEIWGWIRNVTPQFTNYVTTYDTVDLTKTYISQRLKIFVNHSCNQMSMLYHLFSKINDWLNSFILSFVKHKYETCT